MTTSDLPPRARGRSARFLVPLLASLALVAPPSPVHAGEPSKEDVANAKSLAKEGRELRDKGKFKEALVKFEAAYAYVPTPLTGRDLAQELERDGKLVEARTVWADVSKMAAKPGDTKEHADARALAGSKVTELDKRIPTVILEVTDGGANPPKVTLDDKDVPAATLGTSRLVNPGSHTFTASAGGPEAVTTTFTVKEGEKDRKVSLSVKKTAGAKAPGKEPTVDPGKNPQDPGKEPVKESPKDPVNNNPPPPPPMGPRVPSEGGAVAGGLLAVFGSLGIMTGGALLGLGFYQGDNDGKSTLRWVGGGVLVGSAAMLTVGVVLLASNSPTASARLPTTTVHLGLSPNGFLLAGRF